jgi:hypothetical protein
MVTSNLRARNVRVYLRRPLHPIQLRVRHVVVFAIVSTVAVMAPASANGTLVVDGQIGPALLLRSRSRAIGHGVKPIARLGLRTQIAPRLEVGGSVSALLDPSEHYRVLGGLATARFALWQRSAFSLGAALGLGAGHDADILHSDLDADAPVAPYGTVAFDARWRIGDRWLLGAETGWDNLSIVRIGVLVGFRFGARR